MDLRDLVAALLRRDALGARQCVADAARERFDWSGVGEPHDLSPAGRAVAAAVVEMMAERMGRRPAAWTAAVPAAPERLFLVEAAEVLPRLRFLTAA